MTTPTNCPHCGAEKRDRNLLIRVEHIKYSCGTLYVNGRKQYQTEQCERNVIQNELDKLRAENAELRQLATDIMRSSDHECDHSVNCGFDDEGERVCCFDAISQRYQAALKGAQE